MAEVQAAPQPFVLVQPPEETARLFLARALPWPTHSDPPEFFVIIVVLGRPDPAKPGEKPKRRQYVCTQPRDAEWFIKRAIDKNEGDVYVVMSAQTGMEQKTDQKSGRSYWAVPYTGRAMSRRPVYHKSFYIDVDVKLGAYATTEEARTEFEKFRVAVGLPTPSYIILSGSGGFHVHWVLDVAIPTMQWARIAQALKNAIIKHGLKADPGVTGSASNLLRLPGTFNYKHTPPRPVILDHAGSEHPVEAIETPLLPYADQTPVSAKVTAHVPKVSLAHLGPLSPLAAQLKQGDLAPNLHDRPSITALAQVCPFVLQAGATGGAHHRNPQWFIAAQIAFYTKEGSKALHLMADQHWDYTVQKNDELYDRIARERVVGSSYGWPSCQTIMTEGSAECATCPYWISGEARKAKTSPFHFIAKLNGAAHPNGAAPATPIDWETADRELYGPIPSGCYRNREGYIFIIEAEATDGGTVKEAYKPLSILPMRHIDVTKDPSLMICEVTIAKDPVQVEIPLGALGDARRLSTMLGDRFGYPLTVPQSKLFGEVFMPFVQDLLKKKEERLKVERNGWTFDEDNVCTGFVFAGVRYDPAGEKRVAIFDRELHEHYRPVGSIEPWKMALDLVLREHPALWVLVAASFGAPLMPFTGENGAMICAFSNGSGRGKSGAVKVGQGVWGSTSKKIMSVDDTRNAADRTLGAMNNIVVYWDEIIEFTPELMRLIPQLGQGQTRKKLNRSSEFMEVRDFSTLFVLATNFSVTDAAARFHRTTPAPLLRVLEYEVPALTNITDNTGIVFDDLRRNFGNAGALYAKYLGSKVGTIREYVQAVLASIKEDLKPTRDERYWIATMACLIGGADLANRAGLASFDVGRLYAFLKRELLRLRQFITETGGNIEDPEDLKRLLTGFINSHPGSFIKTDDMTRPGRGRPPAILVTYPKGALPTTKPRLVAQYAETPQALRVSKNMFFEYLELRKVPNRNQIVQNVVKLLGATVHQRMALAAGAPQWVQFPEPLIELDLSRPDLQDLIP